VTRWRSWPLSLRLVLSIVALTALVSVIVGVVTAVVLRGVLVARLDDQLRTSVAGLGGPAGPGGPGSPDAADLLRQGALLLAVEDDEVTASGYLTYDGIDPLDAAQQRAVLAAAGAAPASVTLDELGEYRVIATARGDDVVVVGLPQAEANDTIRELLVIIAVVALAALALGAAAAYAVVRTALRPLGRVAATAARVSELPLDRGDVELAERVPDSDTDERTEVGQVGAAINRMLGHVASALSSREASERKVRRFVADASHELRTPLASIRGYAELTRRGGHELPPDVVHAMGRVESEAVRMTSLVEDLLLLARLDEGRDLELRDVDLSVLLVDAVSDAHAAAPDHRFALDLPGPEQDGGADGGAESAETGGPVVVSGDDGRLRQVFANLLGNARVHTPPGTSVTVSLRVEPGADALEPGRARVTVADDGPGVPEAVLPVLFERFARADTSRSRTAGSTGLGLAIVRAVVAGHGGTVEVASSPGRTEFAVRLPLAPAASATLAPIAAPADRLAP